MPIPIIEQIAENIKDTVNLITTAIGFNQTLHAIRPSRTDFNKTTWDDLTVLINQTTSEKLSAEMGIINRRQHFLLSCIVIDSKDAIISIDTRLNQVAADIEKKLYEDIRRGELAIDTDVGDAVPFIDEETAMSGIAVQMSVDYRYKEGDPYTAA